MNIKYGFLILLIITAIGMYFVYGEKDIEISKPSSGKNIIVFGDSLVSGVGASKDKDFVTLIERELGLQVINSGIPGDTTVTAKLRFKNDVLDNNPKVVVILLGGNDFLARIPRGTTVENLRYFVDQSKAKGAGVVLVGVRSIIYSSDYEKIARETGSVYVPNILDETYGDKNLMSDPIHPNDAGYQVFADKILPAIKSLL